MQLPKRIDAHIQESDSWKIFQNEVPAEWLIRQVSERDYGIDCYLELVTKDKEVAGDLLSGQLKGIHKIDWAGTLKSRTATFSGVKIETIHYWMNLPVPVFLLAADLTERKLFFAAVKQQVRTQYSKYLKQDSMSFTLHESCQFGTEDGLMIFLMHYFMEKVHNNFTSNIRTLFLHWRRYLEFIQSMQGLDPFLGAETEDELLFIHLYLLLNDLSNYFGLDWDLESLTDILKNDKETWKDSHCLIHYQTFTNILPKMESIFFEVIQKVRNRVVEKEKDFWETTDLILYRIAVSLDYLKPGYSAY